MCLCAQISVSVERELGEMNRLRTTGRGYFIEDTVSGGSWKGTSVMSLISLQPKTGTDELDSSRI